MIMSSKKRKILAIDESKAMRFLLQTVLGNQYQVVTAADGCSALYWLSKKNLPDIIIADPEMPDMQNWELIQHLRSSRLYAHLPIILLSALDPVETADQCEAFEVSTHFQQPFNPEHLLRAVETIFENEKPKAGFLKVV
jgi:two-component system, chemotaxis family, chemotaxis protein CheY